MHPPPHLNTVTNHSPSFKKKDPMLVRQLCKDQLIQLKPSVEVTEHHGNVSVQDVMVL